MSERINSGKLSKFELEILETITDGITHNYGIAVKLGTTVSVIKNNVHSMGRKLGVSPNPEKDRTRTRKIEIIKAAIEQGEINPFQPTILDEKIIIDRST